MVVHTKAAGRTTIKVTVESKNSSFGHFEGNLLELSDEIQILVSSHLNLVPVDQEAYVAGLGSGLEQSSHTHIHCILEDKVSWVLSEGESTCCKSLVTRI